MSWVTIIFSFGGALLGGLLGTFATISHERAAEIRTRQLSAAEAFLTTAMRASSELRVPETITPDGIVEGFTRANEAIYPYIPLIQLLFGRKSKPALLAQSVWGNFAKIADLLVVSTTPAGLDRVGDIRQHHHLALRELDEFADAAATEIRRSLFRRRRRQEPEPSRAT